MSNDPDGRWKPIRSAADIPADLSASQSFQTATVEVTPIAATQTQTAVERVRARRAEAAAFWERTRAEAEAKNFLPPESFLTDESADAFGPDPEEEDEGDEPPDEETETPSPAAQEAPVAFSDQVLTLARIAASIERKHRWTGGKDHKRIHKLTRAAFKLARRIAVHERHSTK